MNPKVDAVVARAKRWPNETLELRSLLVDCDLQEELKWGKPCYTAVGSNIAIIQGFKNHCSLMFFKGVLLNDTHGVLVSQGANSHSAMRIEFTSLEQIAELAPVVRAYVEQAIALEERGAKVEFREKHELVFPEELTQKLEEDPALAAAFHALTPGRQRGYNLYFAGAKQSKTRAARIDKHAARILEGKGLNDR